MPKSPNWGLLGRSRGLGIMESGGNVYFPYSVYFTGLPDGSLPSEWVGANWVISGAKAVCNPTISEEKLTNPNFDSWTGGNPDGWSFIGGVETGTRYVEESPAGVAHFISDTNNFGIRNAYNVTLLRKTWVQFQVELISHVSGTISAILGQDAASSIGMQAGRIGKQIITPYLRSDLAGGCDLTATSQPVEGSTDNESVKILTGLYTLLPPTQKDVTVKATINPVTHLSLGLYNGKIWSGVIARADSQTNPQNFVLGCISSAGNLEIWKFVNGVRTQIGTLASAVVSADTLLELRVSGTTYSLWYAGAQKVVPIVINEPTINDNTIHGMFSTNGGNNVKSFFLHSSQVTDTLYIGGSNTAGAWTGYTSANADLITTENAQNAYVSGQGSWYGLIRLQTDLIALAPDVIFLEFAVNDAGDLQSGSAPNYWQPAAEAMIRRIRIALPDARVVCVNLVQQEEFCAHVGYPTSRDKWVTLCQKYDIDFYRADLWIQAIYGTPTPTLAQCQVYGDFIHFTAAGHIAIANMLLPHLSRWYPHNDRGWTGNLADYNPPIYDDADDFAQPPQIINGQDMAQTGTWNVVGTTINSNTVDSTASYTGTFCSFGWDTAVAGAVLWQLDGGAWVAWNVANQVTAVRQIHTFARGLHTVTIKVVSGTVTINQFLAI